MTHPHPRTGSRTGGAAPAPLLVVGDALLDRDVHGSADRLAPDAPVPVVGGCTDTVRPGGAALAALLAAREGREVTLVTALGGDPASRKLRALLQGRVRLVALPLDGELPEKTRVLAGGRPVLRLDRGEGRAAAATPEARSAVAAANAVLVADYGRGTADALRDALESASRHTPLVWDPHPRGGPPVPGARLVTPTAAEAHAFAEAERARDCARARARAQDDGAGNGGTDGRAGPGASSGASPGTAPGGPPSGGHDSHELRAAAGDARLLVDAWGVASVAVTLGARGALVTHGGSPLLVPAPERRGEDPCGAGDCLAAAAAGLLADGALPEEALQGAVPAATAYVAAGGARALARPERAAAPQTRPAATDATPDAAPDAGSAGSAAGSAAGTAEANGSAGDTAEAVVARTRARGGTVVATGGCFDLLHAGHIGLLQAARRTGDCLVVCLNSDHSVRRRKGPSRPLTPVADRMRVLKALECVDAVAVFDEDTPEALLDRLRPDIWVKGGDYALAELPEAALLEQWGGQAVLLPYLDGRSTTRIAARAAAGRGAA